MAAALFFREVPYGSDDYNRMVALREDVLRKPLGRVFKPEELANDPHYVHLAGFDEKGDVVATTLLHRLNENQIRFRQVAVKESQQNIGIGKALMAYAERISVQRGCIEIILHARENAVKFYERMGYVSEGEYVEEVGVPHIWMRKPVVRA